jgi:hypothetical protein
MHLFKSPMFRICEPFASVAQNDGEYRPRYAGPAYAHRRKKAFGYKRTADVAVPMDEAAVIETSRYDSDAA